MNVRKYITVLSEILLAASLFLSGQNALAGVAGHTQFVNGSVLLTNAAGETRPMRKGHAVHESDTVVTAKGGSAQIKMLDGGQIAVRPDSQLKIDKYVFSGKEDGNERSFFTLIKGGFRAITGLIGHTNKENYRIAANGSTIGIRGTDHETMLVVPGSELAVIAPVGLYNKVNSGETVMTTNKGTINILPNQMGFAAAADQMPQLQPVNLDIFAVTPAPALHDSGLKTFGSGNAGTGSAIQEQYTTPGAATQQNPAVSRPITGEGVTSPQPIRF